MLTYFLEFSFSSAVSDGLSILTSIITFIQNNGLLISVVILSIVMSAVFAVIARLRG